MRYTAIETHKYAPELNKLVFSNGATFNTPGLTSIKAIREKYFRPAKAGKYATVKYTHDKHACLTSVNSGFLKDGYRTLQSVLLTLKTKHNIPGGVYKIKIKTI